MTELKIDHEVIEGMLGDLQKHLQLTKNFSQQGLDKIQEIKTLLDKVAIRQLQKPEEISQ